MESFWQTPTPTHTTITRTTTNSQSSSRNKTNKRRLRGGRQKTNYTYKTPNVQRSIEGYIQRTPTTERDPAPRGGSSIKEGGAAAATRKEKKSASSTSSSDRKSVTIINYFTLLPRLEIDNDRNVNENATRNTTRNKRSPTGIG